MESFLIYLVKSAGLLSLFYIFYSLLLRKDTSFTTNRKFLLGGLFASAVLPAIYFTRTIFIEATKNQFYYTEGDFSITEVIPEEPVISPLQLFFLLYLLGVLFMAARLILQLISLSRLLISGNKSNLNGAKVIETSQRVAPFSFLNYIVLNPALHSQSELIHILKHEKVHVSQAHSLDVILANLNLVYQWFNPFAWHYLKNLQQNLEYIADREAVKEVSCKKEYQKALVRISVENLNLSLTNNFYQSLIKKRILMLNKKNSSKRNDWKVGLIIPVLLGFLFLFNVKTVAQVKEKESAASEEKTNLEISVNITEITKQEQLDHYTKLFEKYNVQLNFKDVVYNEAGLLTSITAEFLDRNSNNSGSTARSAPGGIKGFTFFYNEEKGSGFRSGTDTGAVNSNSFLTKLGEEPLIIVEGKTYTSAELSGKTIKILGSVSSLDPVEAEKTYGKTAKSGALVIEKGEIINDFKAELKQIDLKNSAVKNDYIQIKEGSTPTFISLNNSAQASKSSQMRNNIVIVNSEGEEDEDPLYIVNGNVVTATSVDSLNNVLIDSIQVFKGANATAVHGAKGKNGVVVIYTDNDSVKSKRFTKQVFTSTGPTFVKDRSISVTSVSGSDKDSTLFNRTTSYIRYDSDAPFVISADSFDINAYQYSTRTSPGKTFYFQNNDKPLYVINGKVMDKDFDANSLDPQNISSINVIKGENATKEYGKRGENGVIQITLKDENAKGNPAGTLSIIKASTTDEGLKIAKQQLQENSNLKVDFKNIKRNREGLIKEIRIIAKSQNEEIIGKFSETESISNIYVGVLNNKIYISSNPPKR